MHLLQFYLPVHLPIAPYHYFYPISTVTPIPCRLRYQMLPVDYSLVPTYYILTALPLPHFYITITSMPLYISCRRLLLWSYLYFYTYSLYRLLSVEYSYQLVLLSNYFLLFLIDCSLLTTHLQITPYQQLPAIVLPIS